MTKITKCELCGNDFGINSKGYIVRRKVKDKLACSKCLRLHIKQKKFNEQYKLGIDYQNECSVCKQTIISFKNDDNIFICKPCSRIRKRVIREKMTYEDRKKLDKDIRAYKRERSEYLKSIPPEDLIAIVMGKKDEM